MTFLVIEKVIEIFFICNIQIKTYIVLKKKVIETHNIVYILFVITNKIFKSILDFKFLSII